MNENLSVYAIVAGDSLSSHGATDVTEAVKALYDLAVSSMDYGSGFWSAEDAAPVAELARVCGFEGREELEKYVERERFGQEQRQFQRDHGIFPYGKVHYYYKTAHEHVYAVVNGKCLWSGCTATEG